MTDADQSHRFAITGQDPEGRNRTMILWRETDLVDGVVVRRVVVTLDATMNTATVLTRELDHDPTVVGIAGFHAQHAVVLACGHVDERCTKTVLHH